MPFEPSPALKRLLALQNASAKPKKRVPPPRTPSPEPTSNHTYKLVHNPPRAMADSAVRRSVLAPGHAISCSNNVAASQEDSDEVVVISDDDEDEEAGMALTSLSGATRPRNGAECQEAQLVLKQQSVDAQGAMMTGHQDVAAEATKESTGFGSDESAGAKGFLGIKLGGSKMAGWRIVDETGDEAEGDDGEIIFVVEAVLGERKRRHGRHNVISEVLVLWRGYGIEDATWEVSTNIPVALVRRFKQGFLPNPDMFD